MTMTACTANFRLSIPASASVAPAPAGSPARVASEPGFLGRPNRLVSRLAARISASLDEIAAFTTSVRAEEAIVAAFARNRRVGIALTADSTLGERARRAARTFTELSIESSVAQEASATATLEALIAIANDVDTLFLEAPIPAARASSADDDRGDGDRGDGDRGDGDRGARTRWLSPLAPRELLELRARAPRATLILDLRREDLARTPLTQSALLIPGTVILRGFGELWAAQGATALASTAFAAGPASLIAALEPDAGIGELEERLVSELDAPEIERRAEWAARALRVG